MSHRQHFFWRKLWFSTKNKKNVLPESDLLRSTCTPVLWPCLKMEVLQASNDDYKLRHQTVFDCSSSYKNVCWAVKIVKLLLFGHLGNFCEKHVAVVTMREWWVFICFPRSQSKFTWCTSTLKKTMIEIIVSRTMSLCEPATISPFIWRLWWTFGLLNETMKWFWILLRIFQ